MADPAPIFFEDDRQAFEASAPIGGHLGRRSVEALAQNPKRIAVIDRTQPKLRRALPAGKVLAVAIVLAKRWRADFPEHRVGIVLPPGAGAVIVNLALVIGGKIPVNLNFTAGPAALEATMTKAGVKRVITAQAMREKIGDSFPWPDTVIDLPTLLKDELPKAKVALWLGLIHLLPGPVVANLLKLPKTGGDAEAGLLFTSGSSGQPKGVPLSHRNILANAAQIDETGILPPGMIPLAYLPIFHSFGYTVTLWYPLLYGVTIATLPSPLDYKRVIEVVREEKANILIGTPTFLRPLLKRASPEDFASLRFIIAGAEKTPEGFHQEWEDRFGGHFLEGYGVTETSPVLSVNRPVGGKKRFGTVGPMLPGITVRIRSVDTGDLVGRGETGTLEVRGANVIAGYLEDPERTAEAFDDGWYRTGDVAQLDADGFLSILGRLSRFSKIGGEMVPHITLERSIVDTFQIDEADGPALAIAGLHDDTKGETLVLLTTVPIDATDLREKLTAAGLPNLWVPRQIHTVEAIPVLGTGKLDLAGIQNLATEKAGN